MFVRKKLTAKYQKAVDQRLRAGANVLKKQIKANLSVPYPPASVPGEFPRRRTGRLRREINSSTANGRAVVYSPTEYAKYLEPSRSFMVRTAIESRELIAEAMRRGTA